MNPDVTRLLIPSIELEPWPTLGPEVCDWIEDNLVHGPGDVLGQDVTLTDEVRLFIYRAYEVYARGHPRAGRRRFKRAVFSRRKGVGKTEIAAWIAIAEMDPTSPVRCDGWRQEDGVWVPVGRPVKDPYIPMVAVTEEQTEDLAYGAVYAILTHDSCALVDDYDAGLERIMHKTAPGKMQALAAAPDSRDGARTTFQHFDETHLFKDDKLRGAHKTMGRNIPKRKAADAWSLETTTMYAPGQDSVAEASHRHAELVVSGRLKDPKLLFDHRQASEAFDISKRSQLREAIKQASGDAYEFTDVEAILSLFDDPDFDENENRRYYLNQPRKVTGTWIPTNAWKTCAKRVRVAARSDIALGFDGSYNNDATALVACTPKGHVFPIQVWERPPNAGEDWIVPREEVKATVAETFRKYRVRKMLCDPPGWHEEIDGWADQYGDSVVLRFEWRQFTRSAAACSKFRSAVVNELLTHPPGDEPYSDVLNRHIENAVTKPTPDGNGHYLSKPASKDKIDAAIAAVLAYDGAVGRKTKKPIAMVIGGPK